MQSAHESSSFLLGMASLQAQAMNAPDFNGGGISDLGQVWSDNRRLSLSVRPSDQTGFTENNGLKNDYLTNCDVFLTAIDHLYLRGSSILEPHYIYSMYRDFVNFARGIKR